MPTPTPNQGIPIQNGPDAANLPGAQTSEVAVVEPRLVQQYTNLADRTARNPAPTENQVSALAAEDRVDIYDSANWVSLYRRSLSTYVEVLTDQVITNTIVLQNITALVAPVPTAGTFHWEVDMFYDTSTTEKIQFAFTWPAGVTNARWGGLAIDTSVTAAAGIIKTSTVTTSGTAIAYGGAGVGTILAATFAGRMTMGGTAGNLQMQFCQNAAAATNTTVRLGARMKVWRIL